ncbi:MAG: leucine-rich repeat protein [Prevotella sp.]
MQYPLISEYVKAIQDAGDNLEQLAHLTPVLDDHGEPYRSSGAFAVVFKMQDKRTGKYYALKCFTEEQQGRADAYRQIADELDLLDSPYITSVKYMEKELFVDSQCEEDEFPVLLMDWVEGETMEAYIVANYHNQSAMSLLCYRFGKMAAWLRSQSFAHGDVKPDNIIIRPDGSLTLVDYDGMFVSSMKGCKSPTIGTKDFSHPLRTMDDFDETIDDFSLASIALSLKAISMKSTLLDIYGASDRLLFSENDYRNPSNSKVISALQELMCDKDFCTLYSLFMLALARKELSACSFRLFIGEKPILPQTIEDLSTKATDEELREAFVDEWGVKYSKDGRRLLKAPYELNGTYSIRKGIKIICDEAFADCKFIGCRSLTSLVIPDSVTNIGDYAFWNCRSLTDIVIPDGVTSIGKCAFEGCSALSSVVIPDSVSCIGFGAFENCSSLHSVVIPDSVTSIGESAFYDCESLSSLVIPDSVASIGDNAFSGCSSLSSVVIPESVVNLNGNPFCRWDGELKCLSPYFIYDNKVLFDKDKSKIIAFRDKNTTSYVIPDSVTRIGESAFRHCSSLSSLVLPDSVTSIGDRAFEDCSSLKSLVLPDSVTSIGDNAFSDCSSLSSLVLPDGVTSIGDRAFEDCSSLRSLVLPDGVTSIGDNAFCGCSSLSSAVIPNSVTSIGFGAFRSCKSLTDIVIPDGITSIGYGTFWGCGSLTDIVIPNSVTSIGDGAFNGCESLTNIVIPNSVTSIGDGAFDDYNFPNDIKQELISRFGEKIFWVTF